MPQNIYTEFPESVSTRIADLVRTSIAEDPVIRGSDLFGSGERILEVHQEELSSEGHAAANTIYVVIARVEETPHTTDAGNLLTTDLSLLLLTSSNFFRGDMFSLPFRLFEHLKRVIVRESQSYRDPEDNKLVDDYPQFIASEPLQHRKNPGLIISPQDVRFTSQIDARTGQVI